MFSSKQAQRNFYFGKQSTTSRDRYAPKDKRTLTHGGGKNGLSQNGYGIARLLALEIRGKVLVIFILWTWLRFARDTSCVALSKSRATRLPAGYRREGEGEEARRSGEANTCL